MSDKKRVDVALVERGLAASREKAQALVMSGVVYIGETKVTKASLTVAPEDELIVRQTGQSLHQYLLTYRLRQAMPLIEAGAEPIAAVAARVGFSDPGYFSKLFRSKIGCSPIEYRKG